MNQQFGANLKAEKIIDKERLVVGHSTVTIWKFHAVVGKPEGKQIKNSVLKMVKLQAINMLLLRVHILESLLADDPSNGALDIPTLVDKGGDSLGLLSYAS